MLGARLGVGVKGEGVGLAEGAQAAKSARMSKNERAARGLVGIRLPVFRLRAARLSGFPRGAEGCVLDVCACLSWVPVASLSVEPGLRAC